MWPKYEHNFLHANWHENWDSSHFFFRFTNTHTFAVWLSCRNSTHRHTLVKDGNRKMSPPVTMLSRGRNFASNHHAVNSIHPKMLSTPFSKISTANTTSFSTTRMYFIWAAMRCRTLAGTPAPKFKISWKNAAGICKKRTSWSCGIISRAMPSNAWTRWPNVKCQLSCGRVIWHKCHMLISIWIKAGTSFR